MARHDFTMTQKIDSWVARFLHERLSAERELAHADVLCQACSPSAHDDVKGVLNRQRAVAKERCEKAHERLLKTIAQAVEASADPHDHKATLRHLKRLVSAFNSTNLHELVEAHKSAMQWLSLYHIADEASET
jgi:hypothetical protein